MPNIKFPSNPSIGDTLEHQNYVYEWDGVKWISKFEVLNMMDLRPTDFSILYDQVTGDVWKVTEIIDGDEKVTEFIYHNNRLDRIYETYRGILRTEIYRYGLSGELIGIDVY